MVIINYGVSFEKPNLEKEKEGFLCKMDVPMAQIEQVNYFTTIDTRPGMAESWANINVQTDKAAKMHGSGVNEAMATTNYVRVKISLTFPPDGITFAEILDRIEIYIFEEGATVPYSSCIIKANTRLNQKDSVDYEASLIYPQMNTGKYVLNIKIFGNYE